MHNWGSSGSITLDHGLDSNLQPSPNGRANGRLNGVNGRSNSTNGTNSRSNGHRPSDPTNRKRPRDAIYPEETYKLRPDPSDDLEHIEVSGISRARATMPSASQP